jgi:hypothetical protein
LPNEEKPMANTALDVLFAWAQQQSPQQQETLSVKVWGISSVSVFPAASHYGSGTLTYSAGGWRDIALPGEPPFWIDFPGRFQGTVKMPQWQQNDTGRPPGGFTAVEIPMVITGLILELDTYHVTFYEPPQSFSAVGSATSVSLAQPIPAGDVNGSVTCTLPGDAFTFQFEAL